MMADLSLWHSLKNRLTLLSLLIMVAIISAMTFYSSRLLRDDMKHAVEMQQASVLALVAADIEHEFADRIAALDMIAKLITPAMIENPVALQTFLESQPLLQDLFNAGVIALRADGNAIAEMPLATGRVGVNYMDIDSVATALKLGRSSVGRPVIGKKLQKPVLGLTVPVVDAKGQVIAALAGVIDLGKLSFLDRITSQSFGKRGHFSLFNSASRQLIAGPGNDQIIQQLPARGMNPGLDKFIQGDDAFAEFTDQFGVQVLGSARQLRTLGMFMTVTLPVTEAFAPIDLMKKPIFFVAILLTVVGSGLFWWAVRHQLAPLRAASEVLIIETDKPALPPPFVIKKMDEVGLLLKNVNTLFKNIIEHKQALQESEHKYRLLAEDMPFFVTTFLPDGTITYANKALAASVHMTATELLGKSFYHFLSEDDRKMVQARLALLTPEDALERHEQRYSDSEGGNIYHHWTNRAFFDGQGRVIRFQAIGEDISTFKQLVIEREQYFKFFQLSVDGLIIVDSHRNFNRVNPAFLSLLGYEESEMLSKPFLQFVVDEDKQRTLQQFEQQMKDSPTTQFENNYVCEDGAIVTLSWSAIFESETGLTYATARDVTEKRRDEQRLLESEAVKMSLIRAIPDLIFTNRSDGEYLDVNVPDSSLLFIPAEKFIHRKVSDILPKHIADLFMNAIADCLKTGVMQVVQYHLMLDGDIRKYFEARVVASSADTTITIVRDITAIEEDRIRREEQLSENLLMSHIELKESQQNLLLAISATKIGLWVRDFSRNQNWASEQWRVLFGFSSTELITIAHLLEKVHPMDLAAVKEIFNDELRANEKLHLVYRIVLPDGGLRWIDSVAQTEFDNLGDIKLIRWISFDISDRKQTELDLQQKQMEVMHLSRMAMLGELSGALAHELNQPLTSILSNAQAAQRFMTQDEVNIDEIRDILADIVEEDKRAGEIIRRLRVLFDKGEVQRQSVNVNELILETLSIVRNDLINQGVVVQTKLAADIMLVSADRIQLQQVLINLVMNACDAMKLIPLNERFMSIHSVPGNAADVIVSVIDQGTGIIACDLDEIFDSFFTTKQQGMGLGLSICRNIISAHGGRLWCENNHDRGAAFYFSLPLQKSGTA